MKSINKYIFLLSAFGLMACEDQIYPKLKEADQILAIDAWVNDKIEAQTIRVYKSAPYFDNSVREGLNGAEVYIQDNENNRFDFQDAGKGEYVWMPDGNVGFGSVGKTYTLSVLVDGILFQSVSVKNRVPEIDSVSFRFEKASLGNPDMHMGTFYARDPIGTGDTYWIKSYKNGLYLNKPSEINIAYDAGFNAGAVIDGLVFIQPIRDQVNRFDEDPKDELNVLPPYEDGDSLSVEIHSITNEAYHFLSEMREVLDRPGGFGELFTSPLGNLKSNISCISVESVEVVGFFCISAVEAKGKRLDVSQVPHE
ncbi:protein of unknown function [Reichenbachiella faecimaris]|uniref:DUF4249 domain-containing protein n=1 Tax=Reichenbachiella faecimaris TaxID=692418 RepID=A0A1W2GDV7_REIFA|nr:DUF4249 domain-containing protein [Reichenbachiella faecimaris]SMD34672.1 protein of unknown function [Reichenbachiella faecimaris]